MSRQLFEVEVPEGTHLGFARDGDGALRGLLFDDETNDLVSHAKLYEHVEVDCSSPTDDGYGWSVDAEADERTAERAEFVSEVITQVILSLSAAAAPHVKQWWQDKGRPAVQAAPTKMRSTLRRKRKPVGAPDAIVSLADQDDQRVESDDVARAGVSITQDEAQQRFTDAVLATAFAREQMAFLRGARIVDADGESDLVNVIDAASPERIEEAVLLALTAGPSSVNDGDFLAMLGLIRTGTAPTVARPKPVLLRAEIEPVQA